MLGDLYRAARRPRRRSRDVSRRARRTRTSAATAWPVVAAIAQMAREERPVAAFAPAVGDDPGWRMSSEGVGDNLGVHYAASTLRGTVPLGDATRVGVAVVHQYLGERSPVRSIDLNAVGAKARCRVKSAMVRLLGTRRRDRRCSCICPTARIDSDRRRRRVRRVGERVGAGGSERRPAPAYPSLAHDDVAAAADAATATPITEQSIDGDARRSVRSGGRRGDRRSKSRLSDGNRRTTVQGYARVPLAPGVFVGVQRQLASRSPSAARATGIRSTMSRTRAGLELASRERRGLTMGGARASRRGVEHESCRRRRRDARPTRQADRRRRCASGVPARRPAASSAGAIRAGRGWPRLTYGQRTRRRVSPRSASRSALRMLPMNVFTDADSLALPDRRRVRARLSRRADRSLYPAALARIPASHREPRPRARRRRRSRR